MESTRAQCLREMRTSWEELQAVLTRISRERLDDPGVVGTWSIRELLAHFAGYERFVAAELMGSLSGVPPTNHDHYGRDDAPTPEDDLNDDTTNAWVVARARTQPLESVLAEFEEAHNRLYSAVEACRDEDMDDPQRFTWLTGGRTLAQVVPGQCYGHHREHLPDVERWLAAQEQGLSR